MTKTLLAVFAFFSFAPLAMANDTSSDEANAVTEEKVEVQPAEEEKASN